MIIFGVLYRVRGCGHVADARDGRQLDQNFQSMLPRGWYERHEANTASRRTFSRTGRGCCSSRRSSPSDSRCGRVDIALLNEAQELDHKAYVKLRAAVADRGGIAC